jgi:hypothetical protein
LQSLDLVLQISDLFLQCVDISVGVLYPVYTAIASRGGRCMCDYVPLDPVNAFLTLSLSLSCPRTLYGP